MVVFAFGVPETLRSNRLIGEIVSDMVRESRMPVFAQTIIPLEEGIDVARVSEKPGAYASTLGVAMQAVSWARGRGLRQLSVVAADVHLSRCVRDLSWAASKMGQTITIQTFGVHVGWQSASSQVHVRAPHWWCPREWFLLHLPMGVYRRIVG